MKKIKIITLMSFMALLMFATNNIQGYTDNGYPAFTKDGYTYISLDHRDFEYIPDIKDDSILKIEIETDHYIEDLLDIPLYQNDRFAPNYVELIDGKELVYPGESGKELVGFNYTNTSVIYYIDSSLFEYGSIGNFFTCEDDVREYTVHMSVTDFGKPVFNGGSQDFISNYDNPITLNEILSNISAYDNVDGDITSRIIVESNGFYVSGGVDNRKVMGKKHPIILSVTDTAGNKATMTVNVVVVDATNPSLDGPDEIVAFTDVLTTNAEILDKYSANDNVDGDITNKILIKSNNYTNRYNIVGIYQVVLTVTDLSNRTTEKTISITVKDRIKPTFSGPTKINKSLTQVLTINDIKGQLTANDNIDGDITSKISVRTDNYTGNGDKMGTYEIVFEVTDVAGNTATHTVTVTMVDDILPYFIVNNRVFIDDYTDLTIEDIVKILKVLGKINSSYTTYTVLLDEYTPNKNIKGVYPVSLNFKSINGTENTQNLEIEVYEKADEIKIPEDSFLKKLKDSFTDHGNWLKEKSGNWFPNYCYYILIVLGIAGISFFAKSKNNSTKVKKHTNKRNKRQ